MHLFRLVRVQRLKFIELRSLDLGAEGVVRLPTSCVHDANYEEPEKRCRTQKNTMFWSFLPSAQLTTKPDHEAFKAHLDL